LRYLSPFLSLLDRSRIHPLASSVRNVQPRTVKANVRLRAWSIRQRAAPACGLTLPPVPVADYRGDPACEVRMPSVTPFVSVRRTPLGQGLVGMAGRTGNEGWLSGSLRAWPVCLRGLSQSSRCPSEALGCSRPAPRTPRGLAPRGCTGHPVGALPHLRRPRAGPCPQGRRPHGSGPGDDPQPKLDLPAVRPLNPASARRRRFLGKNRCNRPFG
jgi:hypothetical protein